MMLIQQKSELSATNDNDIVQIPWFLSRPSRKKSGTQKQYTQLSINATGADHRVADAQRVYRQIFSAFHDARDEVFEFGMDSMLIKELSRIVKYYDVLAIEAIASIILRNQVEPLASAEVLRWLGDLDHKQSYYLRLRLLETSLKNESRWIRDGALLGLDDMGDRHALPYLYAALEAEPISELKKDIQAVTRHLSSSS